jgi:pimeloyl-ACP methyl ester carboxylesterase
MAFTTASDGTRLHYEVHGSGEPVLLVMGLGSNAYGWDRTIPWLSQRYETIAFDNRGVGRSDVPAGDYTIERMAADAAAVLDAVGHATARVVGASLGGMIAQRFALAHPERLRSLLLICTTPGGAKHVPASAEVFKALLTPDPDPAALYRRNAWFLYGDETRTRHPERIEEDLVSRMRIPTQPAGYLGQLRAAMAHDACNELGTIRVPTLVVHGDADLLVPTPNGRVLAECIPGAELVLVPGAGHMLQADAGDAVREAVLAFLAGTTPS